MKLVLLTIVVMLGVTAQAQLKGFSLGPFAEIAWPNGDFKETNKNGYGVGVGADIRLGKIGVNGSIGYMYFGGRTLSKPTGVVDMPSIKAVPVRVGLKYRILPALYARIESGVAKFTGGTESAFIVAPGIGVRILGLDLQAKYEVWKNEQTYSFLGLKAGFNF